MSDYHPESDNGLWESVEQGGLINFLPHIGPFDCVPRDNTVSNDGQERSSVTFLDNNTIFVS